MSFENTVILITDYGMGRGEPALQQTLIAKYLELLHQNGKFPAAICLYSEGVKLAASGSPVINQLKRLEEKGVRLILCAVCLTYYGLTDKIEVGIIGGMTDIIEAQVRADKVITI